MVPKLHKKGRSFKGAARYLLHDKGADTDDRVAWAETRNLAVEDPHVGWRLMAATAMDQARLKEQAGVKNTGRKSDLHALHFSLSWHEDEADGLDRPAMLAAAEAAIGALKAQDRQAIIVCHDDEAHPHVHILLNRVSQEDGRMLSSSKEKLNLSAWAEQYEKDRGKIWCDERVINNAARKRGEYTRGAADEPRHLYEHGRRVANDNPPPLPPKKPKKEDSHQDVHAEQRGRDRALGKRRRQMTERHARQWAKLTTDHKERVHSIRDTTARDKARKKDEVRNEYRPDWVELHQKQQKALQEHHAREATWRGRISNAFRSIDFRGLMQAGERRRVLSDGFKGLADVDVRLAAAKKKLEAQTRELARQQKLAEDKAAAELRSRQSKRLEANRRRFITERAELVLAQQMDRAAQRAAWQQRRVQRDEAYRPARQASAERVRALEAFRERARRADQDRVKDHQEEKDRE